MQLPLTYATKELSRETWSDFERFCTLILLGFAAYVLFGMMM
jgi:hypothetical protein